MTQATEPTPVDGEPVPVPDVPWYASLGVRGMLGLVAMVLWVGFGVFLVIETQGKALVLAESARLIEEMGNNAVSSLTARTREIAALTASIAGITRELPREEASFRRVLPSLLDFNRDHSVAGGGYWPEPFAFDPARERRSFFWGRDASDRLRYFDDYNDPAGPGYHQEEWYVPSADLPPGRCYWSQSYMDPYSYQPMVTCTVAVHEGERIVANVTVDLRLEGLQSFTEQWRTRTGGYVFIVDRNNRFITFPRPQMAKHIGTDSTGRRTEDFMRVGELATGKPGFGPIAEMLETINQNLLDSARLIDPATFQARAARLADASYQIDTDAAQLISAVIADPFAGRYALRRSGLAGTAAVPADPILGTAATAYAFHVPQTYWKLVVVKPDAEATAVADALSRSLLLYLLITILIGVVLAFALVNRFVIAPVERVAHALRRVGELIRARRYDELKEHHVKTHSRNEIGALSHSVNALIDRVVDSEGRLAASNVLLEQKVRERTRELSLALDQLKASQTQLVHSEKMALLGQMVAGLAHEINTPLAYVKNNVLLTRKLVAELGDLIERCRSLSQLAAEADASDEDFATALSEIADVARVIGARYSARGLDQLLDDTGFGVEQISDLVVHLRNFARLDEARLKLTDLSACIDSALRIAAHLFRDGIALEVDTQPMPPVLCAPSQINQVLLNMFANAVQAMDGKGTLQVSARQEGAEAVISIRDTGCGIPPQHLSQIFEPFFTTKPAGEGTGLGLAICAQIVREHGGSIHVASTPGEGTVFTIRLPIGGVIRQPQAPAETGPTTTFE